MAAARPTDYAIIWPRRAAHPDRFSRRSRQGMKIVLETDRLLLRRLTLDDVDSLLGIFSDPEAMRYYPAIKSRQETIDWIDWNLKSYREHRFGLWAVIRKDTSSFAGQCGLTMQRNVDGHDEVEIGYSFLRREWNAGLATEAAIVCRDFGFANLNLTRLVSLIDPENRASKRVAEKVGMSCEKEINRWGKRIQVYGIERRTAPPTGGTVQPGI
jgi:RimJ/RimL family protein N-acetyltransferase